MGALWTKSRQDLVKQLDELKGELQTLRVQKMTGSAASKLNRMYAVPVLEREPPAKKGRPADCVL